MINFLIPIKHHARIADKDVFVANLAQTIASLSCQAGENRIWLAPTEGTPLPPLPENATVVWLPDEGPGDVDAAHREAFYNFVRRDKGRRVLAMFRNIVNLDEFAMVVDDDDLLHVDLATFIEKTAVPKTVGFHIKQGYGYPSGGDTVYGITDFHKVCGTSLIIRAKYFLYHNAAMNPTEESIIDELGSHVLSPGRLARWNLRLAPIPFHAAIYRLNNSNSTQGEVKRLLGSGKTTEHALRNTSENLIELSEELKAKFWPATKDAA